MNLIGKHRKYPFGTFGMGSTKNALLVGLYYQGGEGEWVGGRVKTSLLGFFINPVFVGVFPFH